MANAEMTTQEITAVSLAEVEFKATIEKIGQIKMARAVSKFGNLSALLLLKSVKEAKAYKSLGGGETWESFCKKTTGYSYKKVDEDLGFLENFGQEFSETCQELGLTYRQMRRISKLPRDVREELIEGKLVDLEDKDATYNVIQELIDKYEHAEDKVVENIREINELREQADDLRAEIKELKADDDLLTKSEKRQMAQLQRAQGTLVEAYTIIQSMKPAKCSPHIKSAIAAQINLFSDISRRFVEKWEPLLTAQNANNNPTGNSQPAEN